MPSLPRLFIHSSIPSLTASLTQFPKYAQSRTHASTPSCPQSLTHSLVRSFVYICAHAPNLPLARAFIHAPIPHLPRPSISALTHSFCHSFVSAVTHSSLLSFIRPHVFSDIQLLLYALTHRAALWLTLPFTHPRIYSCALSGTDAFIFSCHAVRRIFAQGSPEISLAKNFSRGNMQDCLRM